MDRALDPELLQTALGNLARLPTAEELAQQLAGAEIDLLVGSARPDDSLLATGWFLFAVASSRTALERYGLPRQRAAFRVASHIFDVALQQQGGDLSRGDRLELCLAAQLASLRSELTPNATAIYQREFPTGPGVLQLAVDGSDVAMAVAVGLVAMDLNYVRRSTDALRSEVRRLVGAWGIERLSDTIYAASSGAAFGCRDLAVFLLYGDSDRLERARTTLRRAVRAAVSEGDRRSRWVAAQLLDLIDGLSTASVWTALPPDVPESVRRAFVLTQPPVAQLWPPQLDLLGSRTASGAHPLSPEARRQLICTPTSGGKTLMAQLLIATHLAMSKTSVCYVAPTRSLCHEVRTSLDRRLRYLGRRIHADLPVMDEDSLAALLGDDAGAGVEVMTPERLAHLLRNDAQAVLSRFGLFVIDEAHNVAGAGRGWTLESAIAFLHHATRASEHRLVLVSAGIGNRHHFIQWLTSNGAADDVIAFHRDWRGPRRLHCLWTTDARWPERVEEPAEGAWQARERVPVHGRLSVRLAATGASRHLVTDKPIGELVRRRNKKTE
jgi:RAD3-like DEAD/DEAH box helicase